MTAEERIIEELVASGIAEVLAMTPDERLVFIAAAIEAAEPCGQDWFSLVDLFTQQLRACIAAGELAATEPASEAMH